eukprot:TRINITY_DN9258_c0_g3_i10.p1 TRINITY_DN9258_c0_g3~~TRINITY_DN9258_c0_g3_i10.p1  ORF type:complete len:103 (-),score=4.29 TRINITY_DN9258_c0_g3_i10:374-682(-)
MKYLSSLSCNFFLDRCSSSFMFSFFCMSGIDLAILLPFFNFFFVVEKFLGLSLEFSSCVLVTCSTLIDFEYVGLFFNVIFFKSWDDFLAGNFLLLNVCVFVK